LAILRNVSLSVAYSFSNVVEHFVKEGLVLGRQLIGIFLLLAIREWGIRIKVATDVGPSALHKMPGELASMLLVALAGKIVGQIGEAFLKQAEKEIGNSLRYRCVASRSRE
jgi:hypothetical protein